MGVPAQPPAGLDSKQLADWHVAQVHAHERLRTLSFYDTGHHLMQSRVLGAVAKIAPRIAKTKPELFAPLRAAGWKLTGSG